MRKILGIVPVLALLANAAPAAAQLPKLERPDRQVEGVEWPGEKELAALVERTSDPERLKVALADDDGPLTRLRKLRFNAAIEQVQSQFQTYTAGRSTLGVLLENVQNIRESANAVYPAAKDRLPAYELARDQARLALLFNADRYSRGRIPMQDLAQTKYAFYDAEIHLLKLREEIAKAK